MMPDSHRADRAAYTHMALEHYSAMRRCRLEIRRAKKTTSRFSPAREKHFVARLEWFTCVNRMLELSLPRVRFDLGEKLEHYDRDRLKI